MPLISNHSGLFPEAGTDEAGRGCLAGPVVAAAVILPPDFQHPLLNDSKQVSKKNRDELKVIIENSALGWAVAYCSPEEIDKINILNASILAMHRALDGLAVKPKHILVDGNRFKPYGNIPHSTMIKGDARFIAIAAASILAKTHRDEFMEKLHSEFPEYGWDKNAGYPTEKHRDTIARLGPTVHHRKSFTLLKSQITLFP
jgi:ribonuclease HII